MSQCQDLLKNCIASYPDISVLVLAHEFPPAFENHEGRLTILGAQSPTRGFKSREFHFSHVKTHAEMVAAVEGLSTVSKAPPFDLIFIDHHHALTSLIDQINACLLLAHPETVFVFDDAVPPDIEFAGPRPTREWWVGEVWMLSAILKGSSENFIKWVIDLPPTGMLAATGFDRIDPVVANLMYEKLSAVSTTSEIRMFLSPLEDNSRSNRLNLSLGNSSCKNFIPITASTTSDGADRSIEIDVARQWRRTQLECFLDLSERNLDVSGLHNPERRMHGKFLDSFTDVYLTGFDSFTKGSTFYSRTIFYTESVARRHVGDPQYSRTILKLRDEKLVLPKSAIEKAIRVDRSIFFGTPDEPDNYGMWILYGVPSAHHFLEDRRAYDSYFAYLGNPWQRKLLGHLGLSDCLLEHRLEKTYRCSKLALVRHDVRNLTVSDSDRAIFLDVAQRFLRGGASAYGEKIFISRRSQSSRSGVRGLLNEDELIGALTQRGYTIIEPEKLDFPEQVRAFAGARVIVGLGGAGMFNAVFAEPGTQVVTIEGSLEWVDSHVNLFASCGLRCGVILGRQDLSDPQPIHKRWSLNVAAAVQEIDRYTA